MIKINDTNPKRITNADELLVGKLYRFEYISGGSFIGLCINSKWGKAMLVLDKTETHDEPNHAFIISYHAFIISHHSEWSGTYIEFNGTVEIS